MFVFVIALMQALDIAKAGEPASAFG